MSDPLERLRAANPVPAREVQLSLADPALFRRITVGEPAGAGTASSTSPERAPAPARPRWTRRLVPALVVTSLLGGAVAYGLLRGDVTKPDQVACYQRADLESHTEVVPPDARGPIAACADLWRNGTLGDAGQVPDLIECVLDSGRAGVFPRASGQDVCALVNLLPATAPPSTLRPPGSAVPTDPTARIVAFREAVALPFLDSPCVAPRDAAVIVRRELDRAGLADWTIRGGEGLPGDGFSAQRPCATLAVRAELREILLVPSPLR